jgi:hypothetical protein
MLWLALLMSSNCAAASSLFGLHKADMLFLAHLHSLSLSPETLRIMMSSLFFPPPLAVVVETSRAIPVA